MKKTFWLTVCVLTILALCTCCLAACSGDDSKDKSEADYTWNEISTADELFNMQADSCYKLVADIDLNGGQWTPKTVIGFDGGGHTIKNFTIIGNGAFLNSCNWLKNCTFDNVKTVCGGNIGDMAVACLFAQKSVENITVQNCNANIKGSGNGYFAFVLLNYKSLCKVKNCRVMDCVVDTINTVAVGGISYECYDVENCVVERMQVKNAASIGGIAVIGSCENCVVKDCEFESAAKSEYGNYVAGVIANSGYSSYMKGCTSQGNSITFKSSKDCFMGGLGGIFTGDITDCISLDNKIKVDANATSYIGGLVGSLSGKVRNCFAIENEVWALNTKDIVAGFIARYKGSSNSVTFSGEYGSDVTGFDNGYLFSPANQGITYCYSSNENILEQDSNVEYLPAEDWLNMDTVKQTFHLSEEKWLLKNGELPVLKHDLKFN